MTKAQIRMKQKQLRNMLSSEDRKILSSSIRERLLKTEEYENCSSLFTFISFQSEVDTYEIIRQAVFAHKRVFVPRVEEQGMEFYEIHSLLSLIPSKFGVLEPQGLVENRYKENQLESKRLMLLPGLAFDPAGNRIGYGAGYYDRYLADYPQDHFYKIALAYDFQVMEHIIADEYDIKADALITPTQVTRCR